MNKVVHCLLLVFCLYFLASCTSADAKETTDRYSYHDYVVESNSDFAQFREAVRISLSNGYVLIGGVSVSNGKYYQAMAK